MNKILLITLILIIGGLIIYNYFPYNPLPNNFIIDSIVVCKSNKILIVFSNGTVMKSFRIALGKNPKGPKKIEGDGKTPEGRYFINDKNPKSDFHKNLGISYPKEKDISFAQKINKPPGGAIKIHGLRNGLGFINRFHRITNWTNGCIGITNYEVEDLYKHVKIGSPIIIYP